MTLTKHSWVPVIILLTLAASASAQKPVRFSSVYTRLDGKGCHTIRGEHGADDAQQCKGVGGYDVEIYYSAATMQIAAIRNRDEQGAGIATLNLDFDYTKTRLEWRLANGKPFAVIMRAPVYDKPKKGEYFGKVIGQQLIVAGLVGFDVDENIDAKLSDANARAREAADRSFLARK
jgi:hypothetical protein